MLIVLSSILALALAAIAAPLSKSVELGSEDALVVLSNGETRVIKKTEINTFHANLTNPNDIDWHAGRTPVNSSGAVNHTTNFSHKQTGSVDLVVPLPGQQFLNWDLPMSSIVYAKDANATVGINSGKMLASGFTAGGGASVSVVPNYLTLSGEGSRTKTWTTNVWGSITMQIPQGQFGAIVSNPMTFRSRGYTWSGSPGIGNVDFWQWDDYTDGSYSINGVVLEWVEGIVTTCTSDVYPVPRCIGPGYLY